jgi:two-component system, NarL family, invasion response regulator UvrY
VNSSIHQQAVLRVLIADDHAIVRKGLKDILNEAALPAQVGEARDGLEAVETGLAQVWDVILLDITMPGLHGLEVLKRLKQARPAQRVVMLSMHANPHYVRGALEAGASGYLTKESAPDELVSAIHAVLAGEIFLAPGLSEML